MVLLHRLGHSRAATQSRKAAQPHEQGQQAHLLDKTAGAGRCVWRQPGRTGRAIGAHPDFAKGNRARLQQPEEKALQTLSALWPRACNPVEYGIVQKGGGEETRQALAVLGARAAPDGCGAQSRMTLVLDGRAHTRSESLIASRQPALIASLIIL